MMDGMEIKIDDDKKAAKIAKDNLIRILEKDGTSFCVVALDKLADHVKVGYASMVISGNDETGDMVKLMEGVNVLVDRMVQIMDKKAKGG